MKQILEQLPDSATIEATFDLLRYENAAQRVRIAKLETEIANLSKTVKERNITIRAQQEFIDLLNAELYSLRDAK